MPDTKPDIIPAVLYSTLSHLGMTPNTSKQDGFCLITYTIVSCVLGYLLVAATEKGICSVKLGDTEAKLETILHQEFPQAQLVCVQPKGDRLCDRHIHQDWVETILNFIDGNQPHLDLPLDVRGTAFQKQVWESLRKIPYGETCTYQDIANQIGKSKAVRAVGNACGANKTALIVPCHRVVKNDGSLGGYRWGIERKRKLLNQESGNFSY